ncbi:MULTISPECIES: hypothetical protein [Chryseobacterium]|uniref:DUF7674 domain-containing protein n=1 Tax=Chryseobacterium endophyticum TaxID=1854762 RepID=A0AAU6WQB4_9FLAO|nr:hypothetical protein [uncultured Chryseobacterium sp.]
MENVTMQTINQAKATEYLKFFYPQLRTEIIQLSIQGNFAGIIQSTINYLRRLLQESKVNIMVHHITMMEMIYKSGDSYVKNMIENLFIRSFESFKKRAKISHWKRLYQYMPVTFQVIYNDQQEQDKIFFGK